MKTIYPKIVATLFNHYILVNSGYLLELQIASLVVSSASSQPMVLGVLSLRFVPRVSRIEHKRFQIVEAMASSFS